MLIDLNIHTHTHISTEFKLQFQQSVRPFNHWFRKDNEFQQDEFLVRMKRQRCVGIILPEIWYFFILSD